jgi:ubiquinone/menaquinone biosynthesis C-methylase UbiE
VDNLDDESLRVPSAETFDEAFARIAEAPRTNALFDELLGPFPEHVEPFSMVPREGLERVLEELRLGSGDHLVDLCSGRGGIGLWFAQATGARLTGVDWSPVAIAAAVKRAELFVADGQVAFLVADAAQTPLDADTADAVVCIDALQLVPDKDGLLREVARLLRNDGRAVITTWERIGSGPERFPVDVGALVEAAGLRVLVHEERADWLERQRAMFERVVAEDGDAAEPALRSLAEEGRNFLADPTQVRRVLVVATISNGASVRSKPTHTEVIG